DPGKGALPLVKLMVMSGKERHVAVPAFVDIFHHGPGNGDAVIGARSPPYLIKQHETTILQIIKDAGSFIHLNHRGRLTERQVIRCTHPCKYLVNYSNPRLLCRHETACLCHDHYQGCLPEQ